MAVVKKISFKTPPIPIWIPKISHPSYINIFDFNLGNKNLWGTETLLGDWSGRYLLLAKDFYPSSYVHEGIRAGLPNPYGHKDGIPTNRNLLKTLRHFGRLARNHGNTECDFLYASACFLLRNDGVIRGALPDEKVVMALSAPVLMFTIGRMPNLESVIAMGNEAARAVQAAGLREWIESKKLSYFRVGHPAKAISDAARFAEWDPVFVKGRFR
jgi:hypothetical protein